MASRARLGQAELSPFLHRTVGTTRHAIAGERQEERVRGTTLFPLYTMQASLLCRYSVQQVSTVRRLRCQPATWATLISNFQLSPPLFPFPPCEKEVIWVLDDGR